MHILSNHLEGSIFHAPTQNVEKIKNHIIIKPNSIHSVFNIKCVNWISVGTQKLNQCFLEQGL